MIYAYNGQLILSDHLNPRNPDSRRYRLICKAGSRRLYADGLILASEISKLETKINFSFSLLAFRLLVNCPGSMLV